MNKDRCPTGYTRDPKKKSKYYNQCCESKIEPSDETCLLGKAEEDALNKKLNDEKQVKSALEKEEKSIKAAVKASEKAVKASEKAVKASEKAAVKASVKTTFRKNLMTFDDDDDDSHHPKPKFKTYRETYHEQGMREDSEEQERIEKQERREEQQRREEQSLAKVKTESNNIDMIFSPISTSLVTSPLKRQLSTNIVKQSAGDCFVHAATRVFLRMISREFFEKHKRDPSFVDLFHSIKEDACDDLYLIKEPFSVFSKTPNIEDLCKNPGNYNSILMYFFLHKIAIDKFHCQGGMTDFVLFYLLRIFNDLKNERITLKQICNLGDPKYCDVVQSLINSFNQIETKYTAQFIHYTQVILDKVKTPDELIEHQNKFFDKIKEIIDLGLYVGLSLNDLIPSIKTPSKTRPNARTYEFSQSAFLQFSNSINKSTSTELSEFSGGTHAVTIVDYDYSKPSNKQLKIKNSWGKPKHGNDIYIYISKKDLDLSPDQVRIDYLEPTNEYSLTELATLNESISDKLPAYRAANHFYDLTNNDEFRDNWINVFRKWYMVAIIFNSTNTINSFFEKYRINSIDMTDIMTNVLYMSTNSKVYDKKVSEDILRNVFDCIIVNLKRYPITNKIKYRSWLHILERNKQQDNIDHAELNDYFEEELKNLFPKTCLESVLGSRLPNWSKHFSRRKGLGKTKKNGKKKNNKKDNQSKKRKRSSRKRNKYKEINNL
jgi:hypothetical protein